MSQAYTPRLEVSERVRIVKVRELPLPGKTLVRVGDTVKPETAVLSAELPGDLDIIRIADRLGFDPEQVVSSMKVKVGDKVSAGDVLCEVKSFFGFFTSKATASASGTVEFFTEANAHLGIRQPPKPLEVNAYIAGKVTEIQEGKSITLETEGALIQGIFGVGGETSGVISVLDCDVNAVVEPGMLDAAKAAAVVVGGKSFTTAALKRAAELKVNAVVTGCIDAQTLHDFVGREIGVAVTGDEDVPFTLFVTEGFGSLPMSSRIYELAKKLNGKQASVNGATQVRAGALRPELVVSDYHSGAAASHEESKSLDVGSRVRVVRVPFFGRFGTITELPHQPVQIESGAIVRVAKIKLDGDAAESIVPRANIELV